MPRTRIRSSLRFTSYREVDGIAFWDLMDFPTIPEQADDLVHTVVDYDRLDSLASAYYGDPILWKVIAAANGMELMATHLNVGDNLRIPSPRYVREELFTRPRIKF